MRCRPSSLEVTHYNSHQLSSVWCIYITDNALYVGVLDSYNAVVLWIDALDQWCLRCILNIRWHNFVRDDDIHHMTEQPFLCHQEMSFTVWTYGWGGGCEPNTVWVPTGALEKTSRVTVLHLALKHQQWPDLVWHGGSCWRQEMQFRIDLSGKCWLRVALCTHSGACYYWIRCW